ncbi:choice-of-anchor X domain-containing protein [Streptomyces sp. NPDC051018]|uniref:choice-of-anchor X domain-containing protein n=1 Tax=Streptomyces sp. NPDC051018 TaxID=3365639 RepID=UPI0037B960D4
MRDKEKNMAVPGISPAVPGSPVYTVQDSRGLVADLRLDVNTTAQTGFAVRFPAAANVRVTLIRGTRSLPLLPGPIADNTTFTDRRVVADAVADGTDTVLGVELRATANTVPGEVWSVRAEADAPQPVWQFTQPDNVPGDLTVTRLMCDPVAGFTVSAPTLAGGTVSEGVGVNLAADLATGTAARPTVVGTPAPVPAYRWTATGDLPVPGFPSCSPSPLAVFPTPYVNVPRTVEITEDVWFETGCAGPPGMLRTTSAPQVLTIVPRPQHLVLVLDRSGSMSGDRWDHARTAAQILGNLYVAVRRGACPDDRIEQLVFEDTSASWHPVADPLIQPVLAACDIGSAETSICQVDFGSAGSCTPIGDGLVRAIDDLALMPGQAGARFSVVLLTDGYENSGSVRVSPSTPLPAGTSGIQLFSVARQSGAARQRVNQRLSLHTIGLGATVQEDVLDALATQSQGVYRKVSTAPEVLDALAQTVSFSQGAQRVPVAPGAGPEERRVTLEARVSRLAVAVLWANPLETVELAWRDPGAGGAFTTVAIDVKQCPTHGFTTVDLAALFGGEDAVPATEWRIRHLDANGDPLPLPAGDVLVFVDLSVAVDVVFDRETYGTGDPMVITARVRANDGPVTSASVTVELARPGESLGTFLSVNGSEYQPSQPSGSDPHAPKAQMLTDLLRRYGWQDGLPVVEPGSIFEDGTNELFDDGAHHDGEAGDGCFANRYTELDKEGTYTWRVVVRGETPDGSAFSRELTVSRWVGITPDPGHCEVIVDEVTSPQGLPLTRITVWPRDRNGEYLGPFRPTDVIFRSSRCAFQPAAENGDEPDPHGVRYPCRDGGSVLSRYDGGYSRVLDCGPGTANTVSITVRGVELPPVDTGRRSESRSSA